MEGKNTKLLQALKNSGVDKIFEAYTWVQNHRHEFKKEVYGPILLEVHEQKPRLCCVPITSIFTNNFMKSFRV